MSTLSERIEEVLTTDIRPMLALHHGGIRIMGIDEQEGEVRIELEGMCSGCPAAGMTFYGMIEGVLLDKIPEVKKIVPINMSLDDQE